jgi:hypothetical protein
MSGPLEQKEINTSNEFAICASNKSIYPAFPPTLRTRQQAYRFAAWVVAMAEILPDEPQDDTFLDILHAIRNT